jgi:molecular chaperone DnaK (HSP70)
MAAPLLARIEPTIMKCLSESGVTVDQLDAVEIVGGSTRVPAVKQIIEKVCLMDSTPGGEGGCHGMAPCLL